MASIAGGGFSPFAVEWAPAGTRRAKSLTAITSPGRRAAQNWALCSDLDPALGAATTSFPLSDTTDVTDRPARPTGVGPDEAFFQSIVEAASDLVVVLGSHGSVEYVNPAVTRVLGYTPQDVLGVHILDYVHAEERESAAQALAAEYHGRNEIPVLDFRARAKDGTYVPLEGKAWLMPGSEPPRLALILRDLTLRPAAERMITEREAWAHAVLNASPVAIVTLDAKLHVVEWNAMAERLYGWTAPEVRGSPSPTLGGRDADLAMLAEVVKTGQMIVDQSARRTRRDGTSIEAGIAIAPIHRLDGSIGGLVEISADVSAQRAMERQFERAQRLEAVGRIAQGVARDLDRTLGVIGTNAEALLEMSEVRVVGRAHAILEEARRAGALATQLSDLGGRPHLATGEANVDSVLGGLEVELRREVPNIRVHHYSNAPEAGVRLAADRLRDLVDVLVRNAIESVGSSGTVTLHARVRDFDLSGADQSGVAPGTYVVIDVEDSGPGATPLALDRAFEPFFTTKDSKAHVGLGLPRALAAARRAGGNILLANAPGSGAVATLLLPIAERSDAPRSRRRSAESEPVTGPGAVPRPRAFVLDDDPAAREFARRALEADGYKVYEAATTQEIRALADAHAPELLITPMVLPDMPGRDLARLMRTLHPALKVLYVTTGVTSTGGLGRHDALLARPYTAGGLQTAVQLLRDLAP